VLPVRPFIGGCQSQTPRVSLLKRAGEHRSCITVALVGDDEAGLVTAQGLPVGCRVHDRHEDVDLIQGV
jgi:hypothetical protein